jgi:hypothetical protein
MASKKKFLHVLHQFLIGGVDDDDPCKGGCIKQTPTYIALIGDTADQLDEFNMLFYEEIEENIKKLRPLINNYHDFLVLTQDNYERNVLNIVAFILHEDREIIQESFNIMDNILNERNGFTDLISDLISDLNRPPPQKQADEPPKQTEDEPDKPTESRIRRLSRGLRRGLGKKSSKKGGKKSKKRRKSKRSKRRKHKSRKHKRH